MSKESKCFDSNSKQKKQYEKWKKLIKNLSDVKEKEKKVKGKNTFEDYFPVNTVTKFYVNRMDYEPFLGGA